MFSRGRGKLKGKNCSEKGLALVRVSGGEEGILVHREEKEGIKEKIFTKNTTSEPP